MQISNQQPSSLANLLRLYQGQTPNAAMPSTAGTASAPSADSATFSPESLAALEASAALSLFTGDGAQAGRTNGNDLASLLGGTSGSGTNPLSALLAATAAPGQAQTPAQLAQAAEMATTEAESSLFGADAGTDGSGTSDQSDGLSSLLTSYGQSILAMDNAVIGQAMARAQDANKPATAPASQPE